MSSKAVEVGVLHTEQIDSTPWQIVVFQYSHIAWRYPPLLMSHNWLSFADARGSCNIFEDVRKHLQRLLKCPWSKALKSSSVKLPAPQEVPGLFHLTVNKHKPGGLCVSWASPSPDGSGLTPSGSTQWWLTRSLCSSPPALSFSF